MRIAYILLSRAITIWWGKDPTLQRFGAYCVAGFNILLKLTYGQFEISKIKD